VDGDARALVWPFLLDYYPWTSSADERNNLNRDKVDQYRLIKDRWMNSTIDMPSGWKEFVDEQRHRIEKDVVRSDRQSAFYAHGNADPSASTESDDANHGSAEYITQQIESYPRLQLLRNILLAYAVWHLEIAYVQGMSDLLSPIAAIIANNKSSHDNDDGAEAQAFWMFSTLMHSHRAPTTQPATVNMFTNFLSNQSGMSTRLTLTTYLLRLLDPDTYAALKSIDDETESTNATSLLWLFRGFLLLFKRELTERTDGERYFDDVWRMWEAMLAGRRIMSAWMEVIIALAMVHLYVRPQVLDGTLASFEDLLRFMNGGVSINVGDVLRCADALVRRLTGVVSSAAYEVCRSREGPFLVDCGDADAGYWMPCQQWTDDMAPWLIDPHRRTSVSLDRLPFIRALSLLSQPASHQ
jgi:hypothetical protein